MLLLRMLCLLMLMFSPSDADSVCPIEPNPVSVQPAVAVEEYGGQLHVNCTSDNEEYEDTIWKVGKEGVLTEDEKKLPALNLSLTDWNMNVECIIKMNDTECSQDVDLTIYKNPEVVLSIIDVQALGEETLYELQCDVLNVAPVQYLTLRWYKNNELSKTDSFRDTTRTPVNESRTLNLTVRREDNVVEVRCEAQLDLESHGRPLPAISQNVSANHADHKCGTDVNPLTVEPAVIIAAYGEKVHVSCTSAREDHEGLFWRVGNKDLPVEEDESFVSLSSSVTDWNMKAECVIKYKIQSDTHECSKDVEMNVYKKPDVVLSIINVQALGEETLYELQCDVLNVAPVQYLTVRWYTNNELNKTDSFSDTTRTPVNESRTLNLTVRREDNVVEVRCEAQLDFRQNESLPTVVSETHNVSAHYAPELKINNDTEDVYTLEGTDISLNCEAEGNPPPVFHWTSDELNEPVDADILNITQVNAGSVYICTATNYLGNKTKHFHIHGTNKEIEATSASAPIPKAAETGCPVTLTPPEIVVRFGDPVSVNCSASDVDGLGWESTVGGIGLENVTFLAWTVEKLENWNENASCYAAVDDKQCQKYLDITVYQTPDTVSIQDGGPMVEGTQYQLQCSINNVAPVQKLKVKWYRAGEILSKDTFSDTTLTPVSVTSKLTIIPTKEDNGALLRCHAELDLGPNGPEFLPNKTSEPYAAVVHYKPIIKDCPGHHSVVEHESSLDMLRCDADGNPPPTIKWYYEDKEVMNSSALLSRTDSGNYRAEFENRMGRNSVQVDITVEYGPSFTCNESYDVEVNGTLQCEPEGIPTPRLTWFKDGKEIVPPQPWTKQDSGEYLIKASNEHGETSHKLYVNILYPPQFKEVQGDHYMEFIQGENVTLNCSAEGNPPPEIQWSHTSTGNSEPTVWRQNTITITGATSTSSGVYICVATNKVGNVTRSVTLMMKGTPDFPYPFLLVLIIAGTIILMIVAVVMYRNRRKKRGLYTFVHNGDVLMTSVGNNEI